MSRNKALTVLLALILAAAGNSAQKPVLIVTTDIGQDPDDQQSMVRLLHYADQFEIAGLVANADDGSAHETNILRDDIIHTLIDNYGKIEKNLRLHSKDFPSAAYLHSVVKKGCFKNSVLKPVESYVGAGFDTEGSEWIIEVVDKAKTPVIVSIWGGSCDLAQALWKVRNTRSGGELQQFVAKLRVYMIGLQDTSNQWIIDQFADLWLILSLDPAGNKWNSAYRGMFIGGEVSLTSMDWLQEHILGKNPLADQYPAKTNTGGKNNNPFGALKEGDSPAWLFFVPNGLNCPGHPEWGGWGGRFIPQRNQFYRDDKDTVFNSQTGQTENSYRASVFRWRPDFQNDFAARVQWAVLSHKEANHIPVAVVNGHGGLDPLNVQAAAGETLDFDASQSTDPDGDTLSFEWFVYPEAGTCPAADNKILQSPNTSKVSLSVPKEAQGKSIHLIVRLQDNHKNRMTSYKRIIIEVNKKN